MKMKSVNSLLMIVIGAVLLAAMVGLVTYVTTSTSDIVYSLSLKSMSVVADSVEDKINLIAKNSISVAKSLAVQDGIQEHLTPKNKELFALAKTTCQTNEVFASVYFLNAAGEQLIGYNAKSGQMGGGDVKERDYVKAVLRGETAFSKEIVPSKTTGDMIFAVAVPIKNAQEKVVGGVVVTIDWLRFIKEQIIDIKLGETGYVFLVSGTAVNIAHPDTKRIGTASTQTFHKEVFGKATGTLDYEFNGEKKVLAFNRVELTGWYIYVTASLSELTAPAKRIRNILLIGGAATYCVVLLLIMTLLRKTMVSPLKSIMEYTDKVAGGDFTSVLKGDFRFEMAQLADNIRNLTGELKKKLGFSDGVLKGMATPCLICDVDDTLVFTNRHMLALLEKNGEPAQYSGQKVGRFFYGDEAHSTVTKRTIASQQAHAGIETELTLGSGKTIFAKVDVSPLYDMDGALLGAISCITDMTAIKEQNLRIEEQNQRISEAAKGADEISNRVSIATEELSAQIEQSSRGAQEQAARMGETATSMEEMNATVLEVAKSASQAAQTSSDAKRNAEEGATLVTQLVDFIERVRTNAKQSLDDMGVLGKQAEGIGQVLGVISDIADQTNLLALNAAIEAARAGEAGRGFAVVADEVRKLAEKTMVATKEVGEAIHGIQQGTVKNYTNVEMAVQAIGEATGLANRSGAALKEIVRLAEVTADQVRSIATASEEQSSASEEINRSIEEVNRISAETSDAMRQSADAVGEVASQAQTLRQLISQMQAGRALP